MPAMTTFHRTALIAAGLLLASIASAEVPADLDARIKAGMAADGLPGMAVSIVEDGTPVYAKGFGVRRLGGSETVDADTLFVIGSTTKAFTSAALAVLVDEGRIGWDDKVIDHLPGFQMHDPWVTREMTIRDLLVHRSGLGLGEGDLLFIPNTTRSRTDIVKAVRYLKPATSFRSGYAYDNVLYVVAGQLIEAVSGQRWEDFVRDHVLQPAGMVHSTTDQADLFKVANRAQPHARIDGRIRGTGPVSVLDERAGLPQVTAPAGLIASSANDLSRWLQVQLAHGALPGSGEDGPRLFSADASREMWTPQVLTPVAAYPGPLAALTPQFSAYALGWFVEDYRGVRIIQHSGAVFGEQSLFVLVPSRNLGFTMQVNSEDGGVLMRGLMYELLDHYLDTPANAGPAHDWVADFRAFKTARTAGALQALDSAGARPVPSNPSLPLAGYAGQYTDAWYGPIAITAQGGKLRVDFKQTPGMTATLSHWQYDTFRADWDDNNIEPAYLTFALDAAGKVDRITLQAVSPLADFSFDYQDLLFVPVRDE